jgi:hypothetical protein
MKFVLALSSLFISSLAFAQTPPKDLPPTLEKRCTSDETSSYRGEGKARRFVFELQNTCETRLKCNLHISILNPFGLKVGHKTVTLAPKSEGAASRGGLVLKVREAGGLSQRTHFCKEV